MPKNNLKSYFRQSYQDNQFNHILILLVGMFVGLPLLESVKWTQAFFPFILLILILATLKSSITNKGLYLLTVIISVGSFSINLLNRYGILADYSYLAFLGNMFYGLFLLMATYVFTHILFKGKKVTTDTIKGGVVIYLLIGITWMIFYKLAYIVNPYSFSSQSLEEGQFFYFSFVTLTTLGYGDIVPVSDIVRSMAIVEAILGQIFLAVFIARLIGMHIAQGMRKQD